MIPLLIRYSNLFSTPSKTPFNTILPFYHLVSDNVPAFIKHLYAPLNTQLFRESLHWLCTNYTPIHLRELLVLNKKGEFPPTPSFHLSFDDGLRNFYDVIFPILKEYQIPATVFLNNDFIDDQELFYRYKASLLCEEYLNTKEGKKLIALKEFMINQSIYDKDVIHTLLSISYQNRTTLDEIAQILEFDFKQFLQDEKPYLSSVQIKDLLDNGITIGAHSFDHPQFSELTVHEQYLQVLESTTQIQQKFNLGYKVFAFPFHDIGLKKELFDLLKGKIDLLFGTSGLKQDYLPNHLHRIDMEQGSLSAEKRIKYELASYQLKSFVGKNTIQRK